jgi:hypothetical protein
MMNCGINHWDYMVILDYGKVSQRIQDIILNIHNNIVTINNNNNKIIKIIGELDSRWISHFYFSISISMA